MIIPSPEGPAPPPVALDVVALINGAELVIERFGRWLDFHDAELVSLELDRGDLLKAFGTGDYSTTVHPSATAVIHAFDSNCAPGSIERKDALVTIRFESLHWFEAQGFNYQNPMLGLAISRTRVERLGTDMFEVSWGGTVMDHDISLICGVIEVVSVVDHAAGR